MSNYIILVKQVPDISQITDNAFDPNTGTLVRSRLSNVINELDDQALAFAEHMKRISGDDNGKVVCLTMGPPMAAEVLRHGLSRRADAAVLLTDRSLGGADTWATANPLAFGVRKIVSEIFGGDEDYFIVSGMQSVDGDTAQVPPQMAEELSLPCIAYATDAEYRDGRFEFTRIVSGGSQVVAVKRPPAVVTVAKYEYPLFATFEATRQANQVELITWGADDIKATATGVKGSKTRVIRVFPPGKSTRKCEQVSDMEELARKIHARLGSGGGAQKSASEESGYVLPAKRNDSLDRSYEGLDKEREDFAVLCETLKELKITDVEKISDADKEKLIEASGGKFHKKALEDMLEGLKLTESSYKGEVWVQAEIQQGKINAATFELIGKARELADSLETKVGVVLAGYEVKDKATELIAAGADKVYLCDDKVLEEFDPATYRKVVSEAISKHWPQIVLFGATCQGRMLAPMVAYKVGCGLTADCTSLDIRDSSRKGEIAVLMQTRPALGGNIMATICTKDSKSQMATARPGVMKRLPVDEARKGEIVELDVKLSSSDISLDVIKTELGGGNVNFDADVIISGGKGMQNRDNFETMTGLLCESLVNGLQVSVETGATRAAVEQGFAERIFQVGQTGTAVGPRLYVALGISGAIQHMIGVANTETIVAINSDPNAPIFKQCDYYVVDKIEDAVPKLAQALEALK